MRKKILMVGFTAGVGGVETFISNIVKYIDKNSYEIEFLMHEPLHLKYVEELKDYKVHQIVGIKKNPFLFFKQIFDFYKKNKYDIVHLNECDASYFVYALPILFNKKIKLIVHSHSSNARNVVSHLFLNIFQNIRADKKWACSDVAFEYMFGKKEKKIIIHNGIDLNKFKFNKNIRNKKREEFGLKDELVFCSIARFTKEKNHEKIVDIFYEYTKINPNSKLLLVGTGPLQDMIKEKVCSLSIDDKVLFLNSRSDISELLSAIDVFLLPSYFEGLPFVSLEGQACAVTFFASTNVSEEIAITDLVHFINLSDSSEIWAKKIQQVLNVKIDRTSEEYPAKIREAGFDILEVCRIIEEEYKSR